MLLRKRLVSILTSIACMLSLLCVFTQINTYSNTNEVSALTGQSAEGITSQMTIGWNLGNSLDAYNSSYTIDISPKKFATSWGNPEPTQELVQTVKNAGFNTIRIPTTWHQHLAYSEETDTYEIDKAWLEYVKNVVDYAYDLDMFVILNIHHEEGFINVPIFTDETLTSASKKIGDIWTQLAEEFKDYDQHLVFEGMNEPRQSANPAVSEWGNGSGDKGYTWEYINTLNRIFIEAIRSNGSADNNERLLMIPGYCATSDVTALNNVVIPENSGNVALSVHAYAPYFFTMDTSEYSNHSFPGESGWGEDYETSLKTLFTSLKKVSDNKGVPIVIGEFSASDFENTADRVEWAKCYLSNAKAAGIPCVLWDNNEDANGTGEAHGYIYRLTNTIYPNSADVLAAMMDTVGVTNYVLPEYKEHIPPAFSWDGILKSNWIEIYKSDEGTVIDAWDNISLDNWQDYISEDYTLALIYDSASEPEIVLQGGWYRIPCSDSESFVVYFTYEDIMNILNSNEVTLDEMEKLYIGATSATSTMYGLYAIPNAVQQTIKGDTNNDGIISIEDSIALKQYLLDINDLTSDGLANADLDNDGDITNNDLKELKNLILAVTK